MDTDNKKPGVAENQLRHYAIIETWNGEEREENNNVKVVKLKNDQDAMMHCISVVNAMLEIEQHGVIISVEDNKVFYTNEEEPEEGEEYVNTGSVQFFELTKDSYGIEIETDMNEVTIFDREEYLKRFVQVIGSLHYSSIEDATIDSTDELHVLTDNGAVTMRNISKLFTIHEEEFKLEDRVPFGTNAFGSDHVLQIIGKDEIVLQKGVSIPYLDYTIKNCDNNDGIVLLKENFTHENMWECHLGNYGTGTQDNVTGVKKAALVHFLLKRPHIFSRMLSSYILYGRGNMGEFRLFTDCCNKDGITIPSEITSSQDGNSSILFNNERLIIK